MSDISRILSAIELGDQRASAQLMPLVYKELRKLAAAKLALEKSDHSFQPTLLVHEAYARLVGGEAESQHWTGPGHFFAAAAEAMRRILIERARRKQRLKHGGQLRRVDLDVAVAAICDPNEDLLALDEALSEFELEWPEKARLVKLKYFAGMTISEASISMGISTATAERYWRFSRAWLHSRLTGGEL